MKTGTVIGVGYETMLMCRVDNYPLQATDFELTTTNASIPGLPQKTKGSVPDYKTLTFQSGIAADTMVFGSVRKANWATNQLYVAPYAAATSTFKDSTTYSIGIGANLMIRGRAATTLSFQTGIAENTPLTITNWIAKCNNRQLKDNMSVSAGYNYTKLGDIDLTSKMDENFRIGLGKFSDKAVCLTFLLLNSLVMEMGHRTN